jgi:5-methylcytosine-specific restriction enzyme A
MSVNIPKKLYSWVIYDNNHFAKTIDKSCFESNGTGIPKEIVSKFKKLKQPNNDLHVSMNNQDFTFKYYVDKYGERVQIRWRKDFATLFHQSFKDASNALKQNHPVLFDGEIHFHFEDKYLQIYLIESELDIEQNSLNESIDIAYQITEGKTVYKYSRYYERNPNARKLAIQIHGCKCNICGFDFEKVYGKLGKGFIEVHHLKPLYENNRVVITNPSTDLIPVCSNCHSMIHRNREQLITINELKSMLKNKN